MLTGLDEILFHQGPDPFVVVGTSDHRFFDRYWFSGLSPSGDVAFFAGTGRYPNMATRDAFLNVVIGTEQHNVRVSREIEVVSDADRPRAAVVGPFRVDVVEPFRRILLRVDDGPVRADLEFRTTWPPHLEERHREMAGHRLVQEQTRYDQVGEWFGWLEVAGHRTEVDAWWGDRDHSWGTRVDVGGLEPAAIRRRTGNRTLWCNFSTDLHCGLVHERTYDDARPPYLDGRIVGRDGDERFLAGLEHDVESSADGWSAARLLLRLSDGSAVEIDARPHQRRSWASRGGGYNRGFADGLGFGARRGDVVEHDVYDLSDPGRVTMGGETIDPGHREQLARITVDGRPGWAHLPIMSRSGDMSAQHRRWSEDEKKSSAQ